MRAISQRREVLNATKRNDTATRSHTLAVHAKPITFGSRILLKRSELRSSVASRARFVTPYSLSLRGKFGISQWATGERSTVLPSSSVRSERSNYRLAECCCLIGRGGADFAAYLVVVHNTMKG